MSNAAATTTPRERALALASAAVDAGAAPELACEQALAAVPACRLSRDQLKGLLVRPTFHGFGRTTTEIV